MSDTRLPLEYLMSCSDAGLESVELSRMNRAANLRKEIRQLVEQCIEFEVDARVARWILERKEAQRRRRNERAASYSEIPHAVEQLAISFQPPRVEASLAPVVDVLELPPLPAPARNHARLPQPSLACACHDAPALTLQLPFGDSSFAFPSEAAGSPPTRPASLPKAIACNDQEKFTPMRAPHTEDRLFSVLASSTA
jgi:hypothetical protein